MTSERTIPLVREQLDPFSRSVQVRAFYELLDTGEPVGIERTGPAERLPDVRDAVRTLSERGRMTVAPDGRITGSLGLTVEKTRHRLELAEGPRYTWCVIDAFGILPALDRSGVVRTAVPGTGEPVRIDFEDGRVRDAPPALVVFVPGAPTGPVVQTWCPLANAFLNEAQATAWARDHGMNGYLLFSLPEAIRQAEPAWRAVLAGEV